MAATARPGTRSEPPRGLAFGLSRLETSPAAPLTLHFLVALFDKTFAFAILAFHLRFACILLHVLSAFPFDCRSAQSHELK
jgi:hypothetical protein